MNNEIILFTTENCGNCKIAKMILEQYNLPYIEKRVDENNDVTLEFEQITNGQKFVPTIVVNNNVYVNIKPHELLELVKILNSK
ncbi:MAG: glutaredoxin [Ignavibacteria bacterium]|jgi:glutaredoxin|nr:glutaredoxin [Ignavibacteria bacterium]MDH7526952.1 glutaredoxin domain-containing protein [Ignavibacteria bacterium]